MKTIKILLILTVITAVTCLSLSGCFLSELVNSTIPNPNIGDSESTLGNSENGDQENDENQENSNENETDTDSNNSGSETGGNEESASLGEENDSASSPTPIPDYVNQILSSGEYMEQEVMVRIEGGNINEIVGEVKGEVIESLPELSAFRISLPPELSVEDSIEILSKNEFVSYAEPNVIYYFDAPNDSKYSCQWAPQLINAEKAWDIGITGNGIVIAIVDSGVDGTHEDLEGRVITGFDAYNNTEIAAGTDSSTIDHGTHCAGIAAARGNNAKGMAGLAWDAYIMPIRICTDSIPYDMLGSGDISQGILWAVNNEADILSCSFGGPNYSQLLQDGIDVVLSNNCTIFASMGNSGCNQWRYPAACQGVIAVGATNAYDEIADFSTTGNHISVCAPGVEILSTVPVDYSYKSGTSMACPFAAGVAALLLQNESLTPYEVKTRLENSAVDLGPAGFDSTYGYGRIDIESALNNNDPSTYGSVDVWVFYTDLYVSFSIPDASVILWQDDKVIATTNTNEDGHAIFEYVPAGDYQISASHTSCYSSIAEDNSVTVTAGNTINYDLELEELW